MIEHQLQRPGSAHTKNHKDLYRHILAGIERLNKEEIEENTDETLDTSSAILYDISDTLSILTPARPQ